MTCELANKLFNLCLLSEGVCLPWAWGPPKFTSDWSLMVRGFFYRRWPSPWQPSFSQDFHQAKMSFFCPFEMCHASQMARGACMYQFVAVAGSTLVPQWIYGPLNPHTQCPQLMWLPQRHAHTKGWNDDIWSKPAQSVDPQKADCIEGQNPALAIYLCLLISW